MLTGSSPPSILSKSDLSVPCPFPGVDVLPVEIIYPNPTLKKTYFAGHSYSQLTDVYQKYAKENITFHSG